MGTVIKQTLLAPEDANGLPSFANITGYDTPADGDLVYNINWSLASRLVGYTTMEHGKSLVSQILVKSILVLTTTAQLSVLVLLLIMITG